MVMMMGLTLIVPMIKRRMVTKNTIILNPKWPRGMPQAYPESMNVGGIFVVINLHHRWHHVRILTN